MSRETGGATPAGPKQGAAPADPGRVTVHHFRIWDERRGYFIVAPVKGTEKRIKRLSGVIVPGTAEQVDAAHIDAEGRFRPPGSNGVRK